MRKSVGACGKSSFRACVKGALACRVQTTQRQQLTDRDDSRCRDQRRRGSRDPRRHCHCDEPRVAAPLSRAPDENFPGATPLASRFAVARLRDETLPVVSIAGVKLRGATQCDDHLLARSLVEIGIDDKWVATECCRATRSSEQRHAAIVRSKSLGTHCFSHRRDANSRFPVRDVSVCCGTHVRRFRGAFSASRRKHCAMNPRLEVSLFG